MKKFLILSTIFLLFGVHVFAKTIIINHSTDLQGRELLLGPRDKLVFMQHGCLMNGKVRGDKSRIKVKTKSPIFKDVGLNGSFSNKEAFLSWWDCGDDITREFASLVASFSGIVYLDREGTLSKPTTIDCKKRIEIVGRGNVIRLDNIEGFALYLKQAGIITIRDVKFKYVDSNPGRSSHVGTLRVAHSGNSKVKLQNVSIAGFDNSKYSICGFDAIQIDNCEIGTQTIIKDVMVQDMVVKGDGKETNGVGANYAISVDCHQGLSGKVGISDCYIENMYNVDEMGNKIYEDTSGIYLGGATGKNNSGKMTYCNWDATIQDCRFKDVSKRNVKVQGNHVILRNLYSETTDAFLKTYQNMYVGINGDHIKIDGIYGQYDGCIVKITGDYLSLRNMDCTSTLHNSQYASVIRLDGTQHAVIEDCRFDNDSYMFIYPTERGFDETTEPVYHIKRCQLNVKHLLYCISNYTIIHNKGRLVVEDSEVRLSDTYCFNAKSLAEITMRGTTVNHKGKLASEKKDGGPTLTIEKSEIKRF